MTEEERLKVRVAVLEKQLKERDDHIESLERANAEGDKYIDVLFNHNREMADALNWYATMAKNCRKLSGIPEGDEARQALNDDGGHRAYKALAAIMLSENE